MIEEADFQKVGNAAIDLCVFVEKLRLGEKHREEADKLTHNVLNLIKQTEKIKEEPLTKGNKMSKKLKIQFWKAEKALAMQVLLQDGLYKLKSIAGFVHIYCSPSWGDDFVFLRGSEKEDDLDVLTKRFPSNAERDEYLQKVVVAITDELFTEEGELKVGEMCEASDDGERWSNRRLLAALPEKYDMRYITTGNGLTDSFSWRYARPLTKRTEPIVEENGQLITYTWEEK